MTDLRLVPAAATAWTVTAAGILWAFPGVLAALSSALAATVAAGWWAGRRRGDGVDRR
ncbi:competence protein, partial [Mycobacterium rufum]|nr:competence protein [Mycolicibacterium rufum]